MRSEANALDRASALRRVAVVATGVANLASVLAALGRAGAESIVTDDVATIEDATHVVLPGVGHFQAAMTSLQERRLVEPLQRRIAENRPTLAICLGMQILFESSEESPAIPGLGCVGATVTRFNGADLRVPQLGWNSIDPSPGCTMLQKGSVYFANSYRVAEPPAAAEGWSCAFADHGGRFVAAIERGGVLACQFHPELSGPFGRGLIASWLAQDASISTPEGKRGASC